MIRKFEADDIAKILTLNDNVESFFPCDKGEWVQWLMQNIENPNVLVLGNIEDERINSYLVALCAVLPPISKQVSILFAYSISFNFDSNNEIKQLLDEWAISKEAIEVTFICQDIRVFEKYGAKQKAIFAGWSL